MIRLLAFAGALLVAAGSLRAQEATPTPEPPPVVPAAETDAIKALAGRDATVEGRITRIGSTEAGGIKFINFAGVGSGGFVAVVFKSNYAAFPDGFDAYQGALVRLTGKVEIYKETTPQIVVRSPAQITVVEAAPTPTPAPAENAGN